MENTKITIDDIIQDIQELELDDWKIEEAISGIEELNKTIFQKESTYLIVYYRESQRQIYSDKVNNKDEFLKILRYAVNDEDGVIIDIYNQNLELIANINLHPYS